MRCHDNGYTLYIGFTVSPLSFIVYSKQGVSPLYTRTSLRATRILNRPLHSLPHIPQKNIRPTTRLPFPPIHPRAHQNTLPPTPMRAPVIIRAPNITLRIIPNHIHPPQRIIQPHLPPQRLPIRPQPVLGELKRRLRRLAEQRLLQLRTTCNLIPKALKRGLEASLPEAVEVVGGGPP